MRLTERRLRKLIVEEIQKLNENTVASISKQLKNVLDGAQLDDGKMGFKLRFNHEYREDYIEFQPSNRQREDMSGFTKYGEWDGHSSNWYRYYARPMTRLVRNYLKKNLDVPTEMYDVRVGEKGNVGVEIDKNTVAKRSPEGADALAFAKELNNNLGDVLHDLVKPNSAWGPLANHDKWGYGKFGVSLRLNPPDLDKVKVGSNYINLPVGYEKNNLSNGLHSIDLGRNLRPADEEVIQVNQKSITRFDVPSEFDRPSKVLPFDAKKLAEAILEFIKYYASEDVLTFDSDWLVGLVVKRWMMPAYTYSQYSQNRERDPIPMEHRMSGNIHLKLSYVAVTGQAKENRDCSMIPNIKCENVAWAE